MPGTTVFRRYEYKYLIDDAQAAAVRAAIRPFMTCDPHAASAPDASYDIESLYLDAPDLRLYRQTCEGIMQRLKLRVREYPDAPADTPVFLEIKRKLDRLVLKDRAALPRGAAQDLVDGRATGAIALTPLEQSCQDEFVGWIARWLAQPMMWVRYRREAHVGLFKEDLRITFDRDLRCAAAESSRSPSVGAWQAIAPGAVILEIKFDEHFPGWLSRVVRRLELRQQSYSKYGQAVRRGLASCGVPAYAAACFLE